MNEGSNLEMPFLNLYSIEIYFRQQTIFASFGNSYKDKKWLRNGIRQNVFS